MRQMIKIVRKVDLQKRFEEILFYETEYELATLFEAMQHNDLPQIEKSKKRLSEIQKELKEHVYA